MNQTVDIGALYRQLFGREAEQAGIDYWQSQLPSLIAQGGENKVREAMIGGAVPADATYYNNRNTSEADWAKYMTQAEQQMAGLNNMPGVFSDYAALATATPNQANALMYHDKSSLEEMLKQFRDLYGGPNVDALGGLGAAAVTNRANNNSRGR